MHSSLGLACLLQIGLPYLYQVIGTDSDNDGLTYSLVAPVPSGMTISATNGGALVKWTPTAAQFGNQTYQVKVDDTRGGTYTQSVTVNVTDQLTNHAPS